MKWIIVVAAALVALAGPAAAEFGKGPAPSGFQKPKPAIGAYPGVSPYASRPTPSPGSTSPSDYGASSSMSKPKTYGAPPAAEPYKPYEPYKSQPGTSLFGPDGKKRR